MRAQEENEEGTYQGREGRRGLPARGQDGLEREQERRLVVLPMGGGRQILWGHNPASGDTTPCTIAGVTLHGVVSPEIQVQAEGAPSTDGWLCTRLVGLPRGVHVVPGRVGSKKGVAVDSLAIGCAPLRLSFRVRRTQVGETNKFVCSDSGWRNPQFCGFPDTAAIFGFPRRVCPAQRGVCQCTACLTTDLLRRQRWHVVVDHVSHGSAGM